MVLAKARRYHRSEAKEVSEVIRCQNEVSLTEGKMLAHFVEVWDCRG